MQIADRKLGPSDVHGQVRHASSGNVVNVDVAAVLGTSRDRSRALLRNLGLDVVASLAAVRIHLVGRLRYNLACVSLSTSSNQLSLSPVPFCENLCRGSAAQNARVNQTGEANTGNVSAAAVDAVKVPDGLGRLRVVLLEEAAAVGLGEDAREAPGRVLKGLHVGDVDHEQVAGFSALDVKGTSQVVNLGQVDVAHVVGAVVVADLAARPVEAFNLDRLAGLDGGDGGDCPTVELAYDYKR